MSRPTYFTVNDVETLFRSLETEESSKVTAYMPLISAALRGEAKRFGKDLDDMIEDDEDVGSIAKEICVRVMVSILSADHDGEQINEYTATYSTPGAEIYFKAAELKRLGLRSQKIVAYDPYAEDEENG